MEVSERAARSIAAQNAREEKKQFYRDIHISDWNPEPEFWTVEGILRGRELPSWHFTRWRIMGWIRPIARPPYYELTPNGEEAFRDGYFAIDEEEEDWYGDDPDD